MSVGLGSSIAKLAAGSAYRQSSSPQVAFDVPALNTGDFALFSSFAGEAGYRLMVAVRAFQLSPQAIDSAAITGWRAARADPSDAPSSGKDFAAFFGDAQGLLIDESDHFDFDALQATASEAGLTTASVPVDLSAAASGGAASDIVRSLVTHFEYVASPDAPWLQTQITVAQVFEDGLAAAGQPLEFSGFDNSQPTPIASSIEWGG